MFNSRDLHDEKLKVLKALNPGNKGDITKWVISGQYSAGVVDSQPAISFGVLELVKFTLELE